MKPEAILIVAGGQLQIPAVREAHELGLHAIVTDQNPDAPAMRIADEPVTLDIYDVEGHLTLSDRLRKDYRLRGVFTEGADVEVTVAAVAEWCDLPGVGISASMRCKNKALMRQTLGHEIPSFVGWQPGMDWETLMSATPPLVVKPVNNCGGRGLTRIRSIGSLPAAIQKAQNASVGGEVLIEECLVGTEHNVEIAFTSERLFHSINISDRYFLEHPNYRIEAGHWNPTLLNKSKQAELFHLCSQWGRDLGIKWGVFKCDVILTENGFRLLECTARLSGGFDCQYTQPLAYGTNPIRAAMRQAIGESFPIADITPVRSKVSACLPDLPGHRVDMESDRIRHKFYRHPSEKLEDSTDRSRFAITQGDSLEEALEPLIDREVSYTVVKMHREQPE